MTLDQHAPPLPIRFQTSLQIKTIPAVVVAVHDVHTPQLNRLDADAPQLATDENFECVGCNRLRIAQETPFSPSLRHTLGGTNNTGRSDFLMTSSETLPSAASFGCCPRVAITIRSAASCFARCKMASDGTPPSTRSLTVTPVAATKRRRTCSTSFLKTVAASLSGAFATCSVVTVVRALGPR